jgi:prepilin-type N-terminal cleavage/methylation domain-containing protein
MIRSPRAGFSLLEVMLAAAILVGSLVVLSELAAVGRQHIESAQDLGTAQRVCQSQMSKILAGLLQAESVQRQEVEGEPGWLYSIETQSVDQPGLIAVHVTAIEDVAEGRRAREFTLVRWVRDSETASRGSGADSTRSALPPGFRGGRHR